MKDIHNQKFKVLISRWYFEQHKREIKWDDEKTIDYNLISKLFLFELDKQEHLSFIDHFYLYLYDYLFMHIFELNFESKGSISRILSPDNMVSFANIFMLIKNPFMLPYTFNFIFSSAMNHYIVKLLADLNTRFYKSLEASKEVVLDAVNDYSYNHPFVSYFIHYSWEFFCLRLKEQCKGYYEANSLALAAFIIDAAKVSLVTDKQSQGNEWERILKAAEKSDNPFVRISLSLYKLCNYLEITQESIELEKQLEKFRKESLDYYKLIGFN